MNCLCYYHPEEKKIKRLIQDYITDQELVPEEETKSLGNSTTLLERVKTPGVQDREKESKPVTNKRI